MAGGFLLPDGEESMLVGIIVAAAILIASVAIDHGLTWDVRQDHCFCLGWLSVLCYDDPLGACSETNLQERCYVAVRRHGRVPGRPRTLPVSLPV